MKSKVTLRHDKSNHFLRVIAVGRFLYGMVLLAVGFTIPKLLGKNLSDKLLGLINKCHIETHLYYVHWMIQKVSIVSHADLIVLTVANFCYSVLAFTEAGGLSFGKRWAYWLVIGDTASFIPITALQLCKHFSWIDCILLFYYFATVIYLLLEINRMPGRNPRPIFTRIFKLLHKE